MKILLIGEYSRLHNSLKEGLLVLGHDVILVGDGDAFKNYPSDLSIDARLSKNRYVNLVRQLLYRLSGFDIAKLEKGIRFYFLLKKLKGFDIVQLINEAPIKTLPAFEKYLLGKLFNANKKSFLLSCGIDYISVQYMLDKKLKYSLMDPYFRDNSLADKYQYIFDYTTKGHKKLHEFVFKNITRIIASDIDYVLPLQGHSKFAGLIPNPVNITKLPYIQPDTTGKVVIFLGINRWTYYQKGIEYFEDALKIIAQKYPDKAEIIVAENIPYNQYINMYNKAHIVLDQVYAYDQGYNALEAMAKGKVTFTGAETEFTAYYNLKEKVAINALPDVTQLVLDLSYLIENPLEISAISKRARSFTEQEHDYIKVAKRYLDAWMNN